MAQGRSASRATRTPHSGAAATRSRRPSRRRRNTGLIAVGAVMAATAAGVLLFAGRGGGADSPVGAAAQVAHVHGLGVDPNSGELYAGTHFGLFRFTKDATPVRIADREQDFMGFSVVGPRHFVASGHPGTGQSGPPAVGLIESTDGGESWETLSLAGQADFHALEARHGRVYGHSGGRLLVSEDAGRSWEQRAALALADLAVSPADPDRVLATTAEGVAGSPDGGRTFERIPGAPGLVFVAWPAEARVVGVDAGGSVHVSGDGGASWTSLSRVEGAPQALAATDREIFVATDRGIYASESSDTFRLKYRTS